jgi:cell division protein FtsB
MVFLGIILLVALLIPIMGILIDSPIGRALGRRIEGPEQQVAAPVADLVKRLEVVEAEVDELGTQVRQLQEENQFLQRLLEEQPRRSLPPSE